MRRLTSLIIRLRLFLAGWRPGRNVWGELELPQGLPVFPEARRILSELGDLQFGDPRREFVKLDPNFVSELLPHIARFAAQLGRQVYPLGYNEHQDRIFLLLDDEGTVYTFDPSYDDAGSPDRGRRLESSRIEVLSHSFDRALWYLCQGRIDYFARQRDFRRLGCMPPHWLIES